MWTFRCVFWVLITWPVCWCPAVNLEVFVCTYRLLSPVVWGPQNDHDCTHAMQSPLSLPATLESTELAINWMPSPTTWILVDFYHVVPGVQCWESASCPVVEFFTWGWGVRHFLSPPSSTPGSIHQRCGPFRLRAVTLFLLQRKHMLSVNISGRQGRKELIIYFDHQKKPQIVKGGNVYSKYLQSHSVVLTFAHLICRTYRVWQKIVSCIVNWMG